jgi:flagellar basal-body rod protein FlgG
MWTTFRIAVSGMEAQQRVLDATANNLANAQTAGFRALHAELVNLPPADDAFGVDDAQGTTGVESRPVGQGVALSDVLPNNAMGLIQPTGKPLDVAIQGEGFLPVSLGDGRLAFTRDGALSVDASHRLVTTSGAPVEPPIVLPDGATGAFIRADGQVLARLDGQDPQIVGRLALVRFPNPDGLEGIGRSLFVATDRAGQLSSGWPGEGGFGQLLPASLEGSNVDVGAELVRLIQAQRAYQASSRTLRQIDEMLQEANNLRR